MKEKENNKVEELNFAEFEQGLLEEINEKDN
jgi:hypothetical protein